VFRSVNGIAVDSFLIAHGDAYDKAEILHRDISSGNILITATGGGLLIDWDLCKELKHIREGQAQIERTVSASACSLKPTRNFSELLFGVSTTDRVPGNSWLLVC
jgi:serine/threonine protein kinase